MQSGLVVYRVGDEVAIERVSLQPSTLTERALVMFRRLPNRRVVEDGSRVATSDQGSTRCGPMKPAPPVTRTAMAGHSSGEVAPSDPLWVLRIGPRGRSDRVRPSALQTHAFEKAFSQLSPGALRIGSPRFGAAVEDPAWHVPAEPVGQVPVADALQLTDHSWRTTFGMVGVGGNRMDEVTRHQFDCELLGLPAESAGQRLSGDLGAHAKANQRVEQFDVVLKCRIPLGVRKEDTESSLLYREDGFVQVEGSCLGRGLQEQPVSRPRQSPESVPSSIPVASAADTSAPVSIRSGIPSVEIRSFSLRVDSRIPSGEF